MASGNWFLKLEYLALCAGWRDSVCGLVSMLIAEEEAKARRIEDFGIGDDVVSG
jgi:hypothetical protein